MLCSFRRNALLMFVLLATLLSVTSATAQNTTPGRANILFTQQDEVQEFILNAATGTGTGFQTGTAIGKITGTSFVTWTFEVTSPIVNDAATISFDNEVILTDLDGDQITFKHVGTGFFHFALPGVPDTFKGSGGTLTGTYEVTDGIGKYASWVGNRYNYRGVATNPPQFLSGTTPPKPALGNVYAEVYSNKVKD